MIGVKRLGPSVNLPPRLHAILFWCCSNSSISVSDYVHITLILSQYLLLAKKSFKFLTKKSKEGVLRFNLKLLGVVSK